MNPLTALGTALAWSADVAFEVGTVLNALACAALEHDTS